jgi:ABC-2 type transport system permease protein
MKKAWVIIKREFQTRVLTKGFIISTLLVPIMIIGFIGLQIFLLSQERETPLNVGVLDNSGIVFSGLYNTLDDTLKNGDRKYKLTPLQINQDLQDRDAYFANLIKDKVFDAILVIPAHVLDSGKVAYYAKKVSDIELIRLFRNAINEVLTEYNYQQAGISLEKIKALKASVAIQAVKVTKKGTQKSSVAGEFLSSFILMMLLYFTLIMYGTYIWKGIVEDKVSKIVEILLSSVTPNQFMIGKIFGNGLIGLAQVLIWGIFVGIAVIFAMSSNPQIFQSVSISFSVMFYFTIFFLLGFFLYATFFAIVGAVSGSTDDAQQFQTPFTLLIVVAFLIGMAAIQNPGAPYVEILSYVPFFTPIVMFSRILISDPPVFSILLSVIITLVTIGAMTVISAKIFRVGILMTGKRPSLPEIIKWLKK